MNRTYKLIASRGNEIVFDDRIQADTPRNARRELKKLLNPTATPRASGRSMWTVSFLQSPSIGKVPRPLPTC
jgi:hypothetical protein